MRGPGIGKIISLLLLLVILVLGGLVWFDYLGVINIKPQLAPLYRLLGMEAQAGAVQPSGSPFVSNLDDDRFAKRIEALEFRTEELDKRDSDLSQMEATTTQIVQELEERRISLEEQEKTFNNTVKMYDDRIVNIEQQVRYFTGMTPQNAVDIMLEMDDQDIIDILRKAGELGSESMAAYWLSLMAQGEHADRAAQIQRKMLGKPASTE
ncbi:MAG: flagellar protein FlbB [Treponema sp.]|jgi:flagellar protein FlbB|nr:flagellar protein FlbB [Treponema sp.]